MWRTLTKESTDKEPDNISLFSGARRKQDGGVRIPELEVV
jgi:hypothetical protein